MDKNTIPLRKDVPAEYKWDLTQIYKSEEEWEKDLASVEKATQKLVSFKGTLSSSKENFLEALKADQALDMLLENVYHWASLQNEADQSDSKNQERVNRASMAYSKAAAETSFYVPEILSIEDSKINAWIEEEQFEPFRIYIKKMLRQKPHTLSEKEERIMALQSESGQTASNTFSLLNDVDLDFGKVTVCGTDMPLTHSTWTTFMESQERGVRKEAYNKFYGQFSSHANTLASLYAGSVNNDVFHARARGYASSLEAALYSNKVPVSVYKNLIETVHK
ncbi:MAG: oligoendopeptidase F, partial [Treponema sp.]|nr:oligoendopeptidase F [Treponema sp.]